MPLDENGPESSPFEAAALEAVLMRFETAWKGDSAPPLEQFLTDSGSRRGVLLRELIYVDLECRLTRGEPVRVEAYLQRFPELADDIPFCLDLLAREFYFRQRTEPQLGFAEYEQRFPKFGSDLRKVVATIVPRSRPGRLSRFSARLNCPHCHNPIEIIAESAQEEVVCPSCGSSLKLDGGQTLTWDKQRLPHIEQFELLEAVGRGAFGTVYKARDSQLQRLVAIKIPRSGVLATDEDEDRFVREARNAAQLQHPGIVTVFSVGRTETFPYLISEFVDGVTLAQYLTAKRFTMREAARLTQDIALGLQHAHEHGVIHRDLKPSNIMLTPGGQPRIMDFGFAKRDAGEITMTLDGQVLGTPAYMSPEQAKGQAHTADARSDIYSIGVILFQLLTGELPFRGDVRMLLHQVIHDEPPNPRRLNDKIPRDLDTICLKCLSKEPQRRYATAGELAADVERFLTGQPILARPVSRIERTWRWCRRNPTVASLSSVAVLLLLLTAVVSSVAYVRESRLANRNAILAEDKSKLADEKSRLAALEKTARKKSDLHAEEAKEQTKLAKRNLYTAHMNMAQSAWEATRVGETRRLLDLYQPGAGQAASNDLRGFEWYYWDRLCHSELRTLQGHSADVISVVFSPDGKRLASASLDGTLKVWDAKSGKATLTLKANGGYGQCVAFSPEGERLALGSQDSVISVWDSASGRELMTLRGHTKAIVSVAYSLDGRRLASASADHSIKIWNAETGQELFTLMGHTERVRCVKFSPDGERLATASDDKMVKSWDAVTGKNLLTFKGHTGWVLCVAFSPDGQWLASGAFDHTLKIWDAVTGQELHTLKGHGGAVASASFSRDGQRLASASVDQTVKMWDLASAQELHTLKGHAGGVYNVEFSPDGKLLATASQDQTIKVWDPYMRQEAMTLKGHTDLVRYIAFSPDGGRLASASQDQLIKVWDSATGLELLTQKGHNNNVTTSAIAYSPDGQWLATGGSNQTVKVCDVNTGAVALVINSNVGQLTGLAYSPSGQRLASSYLGSLDQRGSVLRGIIKVSDAATGQELLAIHKQGNAARCVDFSPDGQQLASAGYDSVVHMWSAVSGREFLTFKGHTGGVNSVAFSRDGKRLASASHDKTVKVWDVVTGHMTLTLNGHTESVQDATFSPDGQRIASASMDQTVKIWDAITGQELLTLKGHTGIVYDVAFSPNGRRLGSASLDRTVKLWDAMPRENNRDVIETEDSQSHINLGFKQLKIGEEARKRFQFTKGVGHFQQALAEFEAVSRLTNRPRFLQEIDLLKSKIAECDRLDRAILDLDFAVNQDDSAAGGLVLPRVLAFLAYSGYAPDEVPITVRQKWTGGHLPTELFREATRTADKLRTLEPVTSSNLYRSGCLSARCLPALTKLDLPEKRRISNELQAQAMGALQAAINAGFEQGDHISSNTELEPLRDLPQFKTLLERMPRGAGLASRWDLRNLPNLKSQELVYLRANRAVERTKFVDGTRSELPVANLTSATLTAPRQPNSCLMLSENRLFELELDLKTMPRELRAFQYPVLDLMFNPKDKRIAYCQRPTGNPVEVVVSELDGSNETKLGAGSDPTWTMDGQKLLYTTLDNNVWFIAIQEGTTNRKIKVPFHPGVCLFPCPSPDGKQIAFSMKGEDGTMQIGMVSMDGEEIRQVTRAGDYNSNATFSPDGTYLAFTRGSQAPVSVIIRNLETGKETVISNDALFGRPVWLTIPTPKQR